MDDSAIEDEPDNNSDDETAQESDLDLEIFCLSVGKRKQTADNNFEDTFAQFEAAEEIDDYIEMCAHQAAMAAPKFWTDIMSSVCVIESKYWWLI
jgi:hypothetical protein